MKELLFKTTERALNYLDNLNSRKVLPDPKAVENLKQFDIQLPEKSCDPESVLRTLDELGSPATMAMAGSRFFGFVIGGSLPASLAAHWLASAWDQNSALNNVSPATSMIEQVALKWLVDVLQLPAGTGGAFVTGTTVANFTALVAARHKVLADLGWNVEADGLYGAPEINIYLGEEAHTTLFKSISMTGLGGSRVKRIPVDNQGRIRLDSVPEIIAPAIFCVQAGNVNTGGFDPIEEICEMAHRKNAWVHVDGAFGLWSRAAKSTAHLGKGIENADSWATDAHKWLNVPYDSGVAFIREPESLRAAMSITAEYLPTQTDYRNPADYTPELSRRARGVDIWAALLSLGREGVSDLVERNCRHAKRFAEALSGEGYEILNDVQLNQVLVSFGTPEITNKVVSEIQNDGTCWCGTTVWQGKTAMRISISGWNTTEEDVKMSIKAMTRIAGKYKK